MSPPFLGNHLPAGSKGSESFPHMPSAFGTRRAPATVEWCSRSTAKCLVLLALWYGSSVVCGMTGKSVLKVFPHPMTITVAQLVGINVVLPMFISLYGIPTGRRVTSREWFKWAVPLAVLKLMASVSANVSILKVPVSYSHTVKALMPIFVVALSRVFLGNNHSSAVYCSLIPIIGGVVLASATELEFNLVGLVAALISTLSFAIQNVYSKKVMSGGRVHHLRLLLMVSQLSVATVAPIWYYREGHRIVSGQAQAHLNILEAQSVFFMLAANALGNTLQTVAAFTFLSLVQPVTYSVANVTKRVVVIVSATLFFRNPVSPLNGLGMGMALGGIGLYNRVKLLEARRKRAEQAKAVKHGLEYLTAAATAATSSGPGCSTSPTKRRPSYGSF